MNMQQIMKQAQKMQKELQKTQTELENTRYEGISSLVSVVLDGNKNVVSVKITNDGDFDKDDLSMLEDMVLLAFKDAAKKVDLDKEKKLGKYGAGFAGLM
ncbi:MAG: YbaB/EbfC family nucleoid-associated protein [Bacilli bacterium]|nr:YbaB/EbfC family nucleoid-associated protein [Bacilli bacterium]